MSRRAFLTWSRAVVLVVALVLLRPLDLSAADSSSSVPTAPAVERVQAVVDQLRSKLGIPEPVQVSILPNVALVVSVEAPSEANQPFLFAIDAQFLARLTNEELDAAVAHELGHVWVFTHHPYLQTEQLANQIAMRVVTRESLALVYGKLWEQRGTTGDLQAFLGPDR